MFRNSSKVSTSAATRRHPFPPTEAVALLRIPELSSHSPLISLMGAVVPLGTRRRRLAVSDMRDGSEEDS
jgi:hypothetical protein